MLLQKVSIIGTGNVATRFAHAFSSAGIEVVEIMGRTAETTIALAAAVRAKPQLEWANLQQHEGLFLLAVSDDAIGEVAQKLSQIVGSRVIVAHCSGATSSLVLASHFQSYGIFYPLQSLSANREVDWAEVPLCVYSLQAPLEDALFQLAKQLGPKVYRIDDEQRADLHVAAVFINNFSNHLFGLAAEICAQKEVDFDVLRPLLKQTIAKLKHQSPAEAQTGPAWRGDMGTQARHLKALRPLPEHFSEVYRLLSAGIVAYKEASKGQG